MTFGPRLEFRWLPASPMTGPLKARTRSSLDGDGPGDVLEAEEDGRHHGGVKGGDRNHLLGTRMHMRMHAQA